MIPILLFAYRHHLSSRGGVLKMLLEEVSSREITWTSLFSSAGSWVFTRTSCLKVMT